MATYDYTGVEQNTRAFLDGLQQNPGSPLYKLSPQQARAVLSGIKASHIEKLPADIEKRTIPGGSNG
jgi:acetyl esterase